MSGEPLVTVGCAVYNGERTLERALAPLLAQDYANLELLIADDCSTDGSLAICDAAARRDRRVRIIRNPQNVGLTENFNNLIRQARGKYFMLADQDDIRDPTFVRKAAAALEADPGAVLCQSHTGAFIGDPADVKYIVTLNRVAGVRPRIARYWRLLRNYSDTTVYGLIRADVLKRTRLWRHDLGSANALLFELLLEGPFIQVPEVLYFYSGYGVTNRPGPEWEYARMNRGRKMPWHYVPFLVLALNQTDGIRRSSAGWFEKGALLAVLWAHVSAVFLTKLVYRLLDTVSAGRLPGRFTAFCASIVDAKPDIVWIGNAQLDQRLFPKAWALKRPSGQS